MPQESPRQDQASDTESILFASPVLADYFPPDLGAKGLCKQPGFGHARLEQGRPYSSPIIRQTPRDSARISDLDEMKVSGQDFLE